MRLANSRCANGAPNTQCCQQYERPLWEERLHREPFFVVAWQRLSLTALLAGLYFFVDFIVPREERHTPQVPPLAQYLQEEQDLQALQSAEPLHRLAIAGNDPNKIKRIRKTGKRRSEIIFIESVFLHHHKLTIPTHREWCTWGAPRVELWNHTLSKFTVAHLRCTTSFHS